LYKKKAYSLIGLAGPEGWGAPCVDPDSPMPWQVLLLDATGVSMVGRSGVVRHHWSWEFIEDVTVGRFPVALVTRIGVVLHFTDGSRADVLLPSWSTLAYPRARAEAAANEIRQRLTAFRARSNSAEATRPTANSMGQSL
jgi:hypothetical protein